MHFSTLHSTLMGCAMKLTGVMPFCVTESCDCEYGYLRRSFSQHSATTLFCINSVDYTFQIQRQTGLGLLFTLCYTVVIDGQSELPTVASGHPIWSDITSVDTITQWREDWSSASVVNHTIVTDHTIRQPGFDLPPHTWPLMNHFRTGQGPCRANLHKWGLV